MTAARGLGAAMILTLALAACAPRHAPMPAETGIGPFPAFEGRIIVIEPGRRWQALVEWRATIPERGSARLTHAASGTVAEIRWRGDRIEVRDSRHPSWRGIAPEELSNRGIMLPPRELAALLLGHVPPDFRPRRSENAQRWQGRRGGRLLRIAWFAGARKLRLTDITRGASATLIIARPRP
ncbi:MAG: lipoprotein insertase outer membrane protein LolB [Mariprofundaceae bacterium]